MPGFGFGLGMGFSSHSGKPFALADLSGYVYDFDFSDASKLTIVSTDHISAATNLASSNTTAMAQATDSRRPTLVDPGGGNPKYANFNGAASQYLDSTEAAIANAWKGTGTGTPANPMTRFYVVRGAAALGVEVYGAGSSSAARPYRLDLHNNTALSFEAINDSGGADQLKNTSGFTPDNTTTHVFTYIDSGSNIIVRVDGVERLNTPYASVTPVTITSMTLGAFLTAVATPSAPFTGRMYRALGYAVARSNAEANLVEKFLGALFGVVVA